jgi:hypothetical protein
MVISVRPSEQNARLEVTALSLVKICAWWSDKVKQRGEVEWDEIFEMRNAVRAQLSILDVYKDLPLG